MLRLETLRIVQGGFRLNADIEIPTGARVALIGPSGAGKSTLLAAIAGFIVPEAGRILWNGAEIGALAPGARPLSIVFQDNNLFPHLTAFQNVALGLAPSLRLDQAQRARVADSLAKTGLDGLGARKPGALSGGQQGRVALARVLLRDRPLMLLDEPFAALGPALKTEMLTLVQDLAHAQGMTVMTVTHDPDEARRFSDLTAVVAEGRVAPPQPTAALFDDPPPALRDYLGAG